MYRSYQRGRKEYKVGNRGSYARSGARQAGARRSGPVATTRAFGTRSGDLFVGSFRGEWFARLIEVIEAGHEFDGVVVFVREEETAFGPGYKVTIAPDNNSSGSSRAGSRDGQSGASRPPAGRGPQRGSARPSPRPQPQIPVREDEGTGDEDVDVTPVEWVDEADDAA